MRQGPGTAQFIPSRYPTTTFTTDVRQVLKDPLVDGRRDRHACFDALRDCPRRAFGGKHVFVEKRSPSRAARPRLTALAARQKRILMVDHIFIYSPAVPKIKQLMRSKHLGKIFISTPCVSISASSRRWST